MQSDIRLTINTKAMEAALDIISKSAANRAVMIAADAGAGVLKRALQEAAPRRSGATKRSITVRKAKVRSGARRIVGPSYKEFPLRRTKSGRIRVATKKTAAQAFGKHVPGRVAHLVELGHGGPHPAPPHPWMGPAFRKAAPAAERKAAEKLWQRISEAADRARAQAR